MYKLQSPASQKLRDHEVTYEERRILESEKKFDSHPLDWDSRLWSVNKRISDNMHS